MSRAILACIAVLATSGLISMGCSQAAPVPTPTKASVAAEPTKPAVSPTAPTKAPEPSKAQATATASTAAPAPEKKVDFPVKGKAISLIVPYAPGGGVDIAGRILADTMEKVLGSPVQVVNKAGAGTQVGTTELARAKPDGYTIGFAMLPNTITTYLDPSRQAVFNRKDFEFIASHGLDSTVLSVTADSPFKTVKDLVDAAKANPDKVTVGNTALLGAPHLGVLNLQQVAGVSFANVTFASGSGGDLIAALLGKHIEAATSAVGGVTSGVKAGTVRPLGIMAKEESVFLPGVKTAESQGYPVYWSNTRIVAAPAGTPKEITQILGDAIKKAMATEDHRKKMMEAGLEPSFMDTAQCAAYWQEVEAKIAPLMPKTPN